MRAAVIIASLVILVSFTNAAKWGPCPTLNYQDNFDISKYLGTWYQATRMKGTQFESGNCARAQYSMKDETYIRVINSGITLDGKPDPLEGQAYCDQYPAAACHVRFSSFQPWGAYNVLSTDYDTYTVVYSCSNWYLFHFEYAWVLSRSQSYDVRTSGQLDTLAKVGVTEEEMMIHDMSTCRWS